VEFVNWVVGMLSVVCLLMNCIWCICQCVVSDVLSVVYCQWCVRLLCCVVRVLSVCCQCVVSVCRLCCVGMFVSYCCQWCVGGVFVSGVLSENLYFVSVLSIITL
jgi:hypothetical protein